MKQLKKYTALLLAILAILPLFSGCSNEKAAVTYKDVTISEGIYRYWLSSFKYYFTTQFEDITDTPEAWNKEISDGVTVGEYVEQYTMEYAKSVICSLALYKKHGLSLPKETLDEIDNNIDEIIRYQYGDSRSAFNAALQETYGINAKELRKAFVMEAKVSVLENYLFGEKGKESPTDDELNAFYKKNYSRIQLVMIKTSYEYVYDKDGKLTYDSKGNPVTKDYTDEQKAAKKALIEEIYQKATAGDDFSALVKTYDELTVKDEEGETGFTFCASDYDTIVKYGYDTETFTKVLKQKEGELLKFEQKDVTYLIKKVPLIDGAYKKAEEGSLLSSIREHAITQKYNEMLKDMAEDIVISEYAETLKTIDVKKGII